MKGFRRFFEDALGVESVDGKKDQSDRVIIPKDDPDVDELKGKTKKAEPEPDDPDDEEDVTEYDSVDYIGDPDGDLPDKTEIVDDESEEPGDSDIPVKSDDVSIYVIKRKIQAEEDNPPKPQASIIDLVRKFEGQNLPVAAAQLFAANQVTPELLEIIEFGILHNPAVRGIVADELSSFVEEYPEEAGKVRATLNEMSKKLSVKHIYICPIDGNLYEEKDVAFDHLEKEDVTRYAMGDWKFSDAWVRTDAAGKIVSQKGTLTEAEVRGMIEKLPEEVRLEIYQRLQIEPPKKPQKPQPQKPAKPKGNKGGHRDHREED